MTTTSHAALRPDRLSRPARLFPTPPATSAPYGGRFVPEALIAALDELTAAVPRPPRPTRRSGAELARLLRDYAGRPSPLTEVAAVRGRAPAARRVLLKREDLNHTGSHKINNVLGQALLTKRMGKTAGHRRDRRRPARRRHRHRRALFGLECVVYMGEEDTRRQALNVARMRLLGAEVVPVTHRLAHAQGRHQRGDARLGHQRRDHALLHRHGRPARTRSR